MTCRCPICFSLSIGAPSAAAVTAFALAAEPRSLCAAHQASAPSAAPPSQCVLCPPIADAPTVYAVGARYRERAIARMCTAHRNIASTTARVLGTAPPTVLAPLPACDDALSAIPAE